jgi:hypothetical protein
MNHLNLAERINWLHCLMQELEDNDVYGILEDAREVFEPHDYEA